MPNSEGLILSSLRDPERGQRNLTAIGSHLNPQLTAELIPLLARLLPRTADPDMALNNLERLSAQPTVSAYLPGLFESRGRGLDAVLQLLATSEFFADTLVAYPESLEAIRTSPRRHPSTAELAEELRTEVDHAPDDATILRAFRRFRARHSLRVGMNDIVRDRPLEEVTRELSRLADACLEVALANARKTVSARFGIPTVGTGKTSQPARVAVLAFGKLGGEELNYSSDIDLMFVYDADGETAGKHTAITNGEYFARVVTEVVRLLSSNTDRGFAYRVDLRLRPEGQRGPLARSLASTMSYYDTRGRTWERQALIKVRQVAGDRQLGQEFLLGAQAFVYRKYLSFAEINEVKALKRQMESRAARAGADDSDVKTGRGGIRDIEFTVQFLQLLNGGESPAVRQRTTLLALDALEIAGCLTPQEVYILSDAYRFLRKTEHRLQLLFDLQTHKLPAGQEELRKLALRMGYGTPAPPTPRSEEPAPETAARTSTLAPQRRSPLDEYESATPQLDTRDLLVDPLDQFLKDLQDKTQLDRTILNHLLHQTFPDSDGGAEPESDLILDPDPDDATVRSVLSRYPFRDPLKAFQNLSQLAREPVPFLSARRCRHFLASIAPQLLRAAADTPDPDDALMNLERVSASLGAKAVLWELLSVNPPSLKLYVDLCSGSPFLSGLLINNPGMIDDLLDSLALDQPRTAEDLRAELSELCRGASDPDPILHSFQDKEFLRIGVGDLLGKTNVRQTTAALSDVADTVLNQVADLVEPGVRERHGEPTITAADGTITPCRYAILGLGKLGGREISYHSDLDLIVVYEADGSTALPTGHRGDPASNRDFFIDLAQRIIRTTSRAGDMGRLYVVDMRLRPTGKSGSLVLPIADFRTYFAGQRCQLWERQSLTRARVVRGELAFADLVMAEVHKATVCTASNPDAVAEVRKMRAKLEASAPARSLKRGPGGIVDVEFLVQFIQLQHGLTNPTILQSNIWEALDAIQAAGLMPEETANGLREGYSFLRTVEARLRIVTDRPLTELPETAADRAKLARRLGFEASGGVTAAERFQERIETVMRQIREIYNQLTGSESTRPNSNKP